MLKIKDDVDLKELEKFGFVPQYDKAGEDIIWYKYVTNNKGLNPKAIIVDTVDGDIGYWRDINYHEDSTVNAVVNKVINELTKNGMVEEREEYNAED